MRILSIGNFGHGWDGSICDEEHIAGALENFGHEVFRQQREDLRDETAKFLYIGDTTLDIDFVLIAQWNQYPDLSWLKAPIVYWAFDYQTDGQEWHEKLVAQSTLYLSKRFADAKYPNWQWCSQDFAPQFLEKYPFKVEPDIDVLFTGSYLPWATERNETLQLVDKHFDLHIYSFTPDAWKEQGFKNVYGPAMDDQLPALIARAKINLSIDHTIERGYWSDRNSQIIACGGFCLTRYVPPMESIFRSNVAYFYSVDDVVEVVQGWLERDEDREVFSRLAYEQSWNYKVKERVADLLTIVKSVL